MATLISHSRRFHNNPAATDMTTRTRMIAPVVNIPLDELRARLDELPGDREIHVICRSGQRAYYATRILMQNGFDARILSGGMLSRTILAADGKETR